jgi:hypothetical protein
MPVFTRVSDGNDFRRLDVTSKAHVRISLACHAGLLLAVPGVRAGFAASASTMQANIGQQSPHWSLDAMARLKSSVPTTLALE